MKSNGELHLIIPGICGPVAELFSLQASDEVKKWVVTLAKAACSKSHESMYDALTSITGLHYENDFPSAALRLLADEPGSDSRGGLEYDSSLHYMYADPVHLQADLDHAILTSSVDLNISESESLELCNTLNQHFEQDGLIFHCLNKDEWLVSSPDKIEMNTTPLSQAVARNVNFILPKGKGAGYWKKTLTEAQMLMHASDVNRIREDNGEQSINSLWFHGSGSLTRFEHSKVSSICSDDFMLKGLAQHINSEYISVPSSASDYIDFILGNHRNEVNLFHLSELEHLINYTDCSIWLKKLIECLEKWVYPLIKLAGKNNIKIILYSCDNKQYHFSKYDAMKFWRRAQLDDYISTY